MLGRDGKDGVEEGLAGSGCLDNTGAEVSVSVAEIELMIPFSEYAHHNKDNLWREWSTNLTQCDRSVMK